MQDRQTGALIKPRPATAACPVVLESQRALLLHRVLRLRFHQLIVASAAEKTGRFRTIKTRKPFCLNVTDSCQIAGEHFGIAPRQRNIRRGAGLCGEAMVLNHRIDNAFGHGAISR